MTKLSLLLISLLAFSCQSPRRIEGDIGTIDIHKKKTSSVYIDSNASIYGPSPLEQITQEESERESIVAIRLNSSLYTSFYYLDLLKLIEKRKINVRVVDSYGFASIIAALYAKEKSVSVVEWKIYKLIRLLEGKDVFSQKWKSTILSFLDDEFGELLNTQLAKLFVVPEYFEGKIRYRYGIKVKELIASSLFQMTRSNYLIKPSHSLVTLKKTFFTDIELNIAVNDYRVNFKSLRASYLARYTKLSSSLFKNLEGIFHYKVDDAIDILPHMKKKNLKQLQEAAAIVQEIKYRVDGLGRKS